MATLIGTHFGDVITTANFISSGKGFRKGDIAQFNNKFYVYGQPATAIAQYDVVSVNASTGLVAGLTTTNAPAAEHVGVAPVAIASGEYGWVQITGRTKVKVAGADVKNINQWTTSTAGTLDDATASTYLVLGINLLSTNPSATATALSAFLVWPHVLYRAGTA